MRVFNELLGHAFDLSVPPRRVVSLLASATETIERIDQPETIIGVSPYCGRYTRRVHAPVVGDYIAADEARVAALNPDLILVTTGIQRDLGLRLAEAGLPVYALPLPASFSGILENILTVAALMDDIGAGHRLREELRERMGIVRRGALKRPKKRTYIELWLGRHMRTVGGRSFVHDLVETAGAAPLFGDSSAGYFQPDFDAVEGLGPERVVFFQEPEFPVDFRAECAKREWDRISELPLISSTVKTGQNVIHEGPSFVDSAEWLQAEFQALDG